MGLYQFNLLSENERAALLWESGVYLDTRTADGYRVNLYALGAFYVEVFYNPATNQLEKFRSFASTNQLEPYLNFSVEL